MGTIPPTTMSFTIDLSDIVQGLRAARDDWRAAHRPRESRGRELPSPQAIERVMELLKGALFPMRLGPPELRPETEDFYVGHTLDAALQSLCTQALLELRHVAARGAGATDEELLRDAQGRIGQFARSLPDIRRKLDTDVTAAWQGDPAARSVDEVLLCYPGVLAMIHHRVAHQLYRLDLPLLARLVAELAHSRTGIDIHPGATIGPAFFIDHGTGVVIGETAVIGERVRLYQNVTLGAKRFPVGEDGNLTKGLPRHPIVEDDVVIYAGATVLGRVTIGRGAVIGGNVWVTRDVPAGGSVAQARSDEGHGVS